MKHDPEKSAAWYLGGQLSQRKRRVFETHMLGCEDCWREVEVGRTGRGIAESARELAPQSLREMVRATIAAVEPKSRPWRRLSLPVVATTVILVIVGIAAVAVRSDPGQPIEIDLAVANFEQAAHIGPEVTPGLPTKLGQFDLVRSEAGMMGELEVTAHTYEDTEGEVVVVYRSTESFPIASGATHTPGSLTWSAEKDGVLLFCADRPAPTLIVGSDQGEVFGVAHALDLD